MILHGGCCGPPHALNVHRDCPRIFASWAGQPMTCECPCHSTDQETT